MLTQKKFVNQQMPQTHPPATGSLNGLNLDLRDRYLAACLAQGMNETNVHIREITTLHRRLAFALEHLGGGHLACPALVTLLQ